MPRRISTISRAVRPPPVLSGMSATDLVADAEDDDQRDTPADQEGGGVHLRPSRGQNQDEHDDRGGRQARQEAEQQECDYKAHGCRIPQLIAPRRSGSTAESVAATTSRGRNG